MALQITKYDVVLRLVEDLLGTVPRNRDVYAAYIATRAADHAAKCEKKGIAPPNGQEPTTAAEAAVCAAEEALTVQEIEEKGWTGFHTDEAGPFLYNYALKGFLCEAARTLKTADGDEGEVKQLQDKFKRYVFVSPRRVRLPALAPEPLERPLRAMTAQGPRVTVVRSDVIPAGGEIAFQLSILKGGGVTKAILSDVFEYGCFIGLGQWRSGGFGTVELLKLELA